MTRKRKKESFDFGFELAKSLVMPQIERRSVNGLNRIILQKIALFTDRNTKQSCDGQENGNQKLEKDVELVWNQFRGRIKN